MGCDRVKWITIQAEPRNGPRNREDIPARLAQLEEHRTCNPGVAGSIPAVGLDPHGYSWSVAEKYGGCDCPACGDYDRE